MYYGYVYLITNKINDKKYVGLHASTSFDDSYWGSGLLISRAIKKYGKKNFIREVLHWCRTHDELVETEVAELISRNAAKSDEYYNIIDTKTPILFGKENGFFGKSHTLNTKKIISEKNSGNTWTSERRDRYKLWSMSEDCLALKTQLSNLKKGKKITESHRQNIISSFTEERKNFISLQKQEFYSSDRGSEVKEILAKNAHARFVNVPKTDEHKSKISKSLTGKTHEWQDKINKNHEKIEKTRQKHLGMKRSEESRQKMSLIKKGKTPHNAGKKYYYNPENTQEKTLCFENCAPEGWINGIYKKSKI
jgi:hypothetical protein